MRPSEFILYEGTQNIKRRIVIENILRILTRDNDTFRKISWEEYSEIRLKEGNFSDDEHVYFNQASLYLPIARETQTQGITSEKESDSRYKRFMLTMFFVMIILLLFTLYSLVVFNL